MSHWLSNLSSQSLKFAMNWWPPFRFGGVRIVSLDADYNNIKVSLKQHWYNTNYVGTHFGGLMFSMTDPFYMLILLKNLGKDYIVWDKAASIDFIKPGRGLLTATFHFSEVEIQVVRDHTQDGNKYVFEKPVDIFNEAGEVVASVKRVLYVRKKLI